MSCFVSEKLAISSIQIVCEKRRKPYLFRYVSGFAKRERLTYRLYGHSKDKSKDVLKTGVFTEASCFPVFLSRGVVSVKTFMLRYSLPIVPLFRCATLSAAGQSPIRDSID